MSCIHEPAQQQTIIIPAFWFEMNKQKQVDTLKLGFFLQKKYMFSGVDSDH